MLLHASNPSLEPPCEQKKIKPAAGNRSDAIRYASSNRQASLNRWDREEMWMAGAGNDAPVCVRLVLLDDGHNCLIYVKLKGGITASLVYCEWRIMRSWLSSGDHIG